MRTRTASLVTRSARFGAAVAITTCALAVTAAFATYQHPDDAAASALAADLARHASEGAATSTAPVLLATPIGGDLAAVFEGEPAPESTVEPAVVATSAAVVRQAAPPAARFVAAPPAVEAPPPAETPAPEPVVVAGHATVYDAIAAAFPEQPDRAYGIVLCESSGNAAASSGTGYYGLWQFDLATWRSVGGAGLPSQAPVEEQVRRARMLYERHGWSPWECALRR